MYMAAIRSFQAALVIDFRGGSRQFNLCSLYAKIRGRYGHQEVSAACHIRFVTAVEVVTAVTSSPAFQTQ